MYKLIGNRKIWFSISIILSIISIIVIFAIGLRVSVDYTGGTIIDLQSSQSNFADIAANKLKELGTESSQIKSGSNNIYTIRTKELSNDQKNSLLAAIKTEAPDTVEISFDSIGPTIGNDLRNKSLYAIIIASIAIILFIAYSFRKIPKPLSSWKFGMFAVLALAHDLLITTAFVAIVGYFFVWMEIDALFITAILTIMGFSVHDTIVIYDRLRENFIRNRNKSIEQVAEESVNQTLARSINTSITTIIVLLALLALGGAPIRHFVLTLMFGILIGTYSSIFVAAPLIVYSHRGIAKS